MSFEIDKSFSFCYGHRVHAQVINPDYTEKGHTCAKCRHVHGHEGLVRIFLKSEELNDRGMVEDFVNLGFVKNFLDETLDHKFILDRNDPWFTNIINGTLSEIEVVTGDDGGGRRYVENREVLAIDRDRYLELVPTYIPGTDFLTGYALNDEGLEGAEQEFYEGFFIVDFLPTSENLCRWLFEAVSAKMELINVKVSRVEWNETPKSRAVYTG